MTSLESLYREMVRVRTFEEKAGTLFRNGEVPGFLHLSIGQEAVAVGVTSVLRDGDVITSTHRGHGHVLAKGADMAGMLAELRSCENLLGIESHGSILGRHGLVRSLCSNGRRRARLLESQNAAKLPNGRGEQQATPGWQPLTSQREIRTERPGSHA